MDIKRAKDYVLDTVRAYLACDDDGMPLIDPRVARPLFLVGPPGIGKTAIMAQVATELGIGLVAYSMTHHTRQSALGLPVINHYEFKGYEYDASEYTMSEIIASVYSYMRTTGVEQGILFLDEVNCVSETLYPSMLQFLQFKMFGSHEVPRGWIIVCAGNPPEYNRSVHEFDVVTLDRVRRIDVEPSMEAWKAYAVNAGVHPAVTTFLETEKECFYRIESTPGGKRFVTARGWDDLSRMIIANEKLGLDVDCDLVTQFVQDDEIAERFSLYYDLFRKYQSDYQVPAILEGEVPEDIIVRAGEAELDERMALLGLLLDALTPEAASIMMREAALIKVRDDLRAAKPIIAEGGPVSDALDSAIEGYERRVQRALGSNLSDVTALHTAQLASEMLKACKNACVLARLDAGEQAFSAIHQEFRGYAGSFEADVSALRQKLENAYRFLEDAFGAGNETLLFTTELTARTATARFISRYGCEAFSRNNQDLQLVDKRRDLLNRIDRLYESADSDTDESAADDLADDAIAHKEGNCPAVPLPAGSRASYSHDELQAYYENARWEFGYASLCHMSVPAGLEGKTVLDIGCRRGKGVFKLSDRVGARGRAIGVDWVSDHVDEALARMDRAARDTGLPANNMEFYVAYPEDLLAVGIGDSAVDVVFVNSVLHLTRDPSQVLAELHRVLKPGGLLVCEVAVASAERDESVVAQARALGNSIQAAPSRATFEEMLNRLGFTVALAEEPHEVAPNMGFKRGHEAPTAPSDESVRFEALVYHATK